MPDIPLPGGRALGIQWFRRDPDASRSWVTLGPVYDSDDAVRGAALAIATHGLAVFVLSRFWTIVATDEE